MRAKANILCCIHRCIITNARSGNPNRLSCFKAAFATCLMILSTNSDWCNMHKKRAFRQRPAKCHSRCVEASAILPQKRITNWDDVFIWRVCSMSKKSFQQKSATRPIIRWKSRPSHSSHLECNGSLGQKPAIDRRTGLHRNPRCR